MERILLPRHVEPTVHQLLRFCRKGKPRDGIFGCLTEAHCSARLHIVGRNVDSIISQKLFVNAPPYFHGIQEGSVEIQDHTRINTDRIL